MTIRNGVIAFAALIVAGVVGYGLFRSTAIDVSGEFAEGTHYTVIEGTVAPKVGPIKVTEFFSYGCVHCRNFDPMVNDWLRSAPKDVASTAIPFRSRRNGTCLRNRISRCRASTHSTTITSGSSPRSTITISSF